MADPTCQQCKGDMKQDAIRTGSTAFGLVLFFVGLVSLIYFPIGTILGVLLWVLAVAVSGKKRKVWKCISCGYIFDRA